MELTVRGDGSTVVVRKSGKINGHAPKVMRAGLLPNPSIGSDAPTEAKTPVGITITAPMVGIFHVIDGIKSRGISVKKGQVVGAIESMKLMNEVVSRDDGEVEEILVEDGTPVEYGQVLFRLSEKCKE